MVITVRCDEVVHPGRARSKHHGALRARDCIGGPSSFPGRFDGRGGGGCTRGFRAEPAGLWNRRVQDAVQVAPVRRPVCAGLACQAIKEADTSEVFVLVGLMPTTRLRCVSRASSFLEASPAILSLAMLRASLCQRV